MMKALSLRRFPLGYDAPDPALRARAAAAWALATTLAFLPALAELAAHAWKTDLHSHVVLVPFISAYLLLLRRGQLSADYVKAPLSASLTFLLGTLALAMAGRESFDRNDHLALLMAGYVSFLFSGALLCLGGAWVRSAAFPLGFLLFMIPLPDVVAAGLERASQAGSADVAEILFWLSGLPFLRDGMTFHLSNIVITVAPECSGIRSSWVLFMTALLAGSLFLKTPGHRAVLAAVVVPLGLLRNGFRIVVIGDLCVEFGPHMIDSAIHRHGGPFFFALSLVPLAGIAFWLWEIERRARKRRPLARAVAFSTK